MNPEHDREGIEFVATVFDAAGIVYSRAEMDTTTLTYRQQMNDGTICFIALDVTVYRHDARAEWYKDVKQENTVNSADSIRRRLVRLKKGIGKTELYHG